MVGMLQGGHVAEFDEISKARTPVGVFQLYNALQAYKHVCVGYGWWVQTLDPNFDEHWTIQVARPRIMITEKVIQWFVKKALRVVLHRAFSLCWDNAAILMGWIFIFLLYFFGFWNLTEVFADKIYATI